MRVTRFEFTHKEVINMQEYGKVRCVHPECRALLSLTRLFYFPQTHKTQKFDALFMTADQRHFPRSLIIHRETSTPPVNKTDGNA